MAKRKTTRRRKKRTKKAKSAAPSAKRLRLDGTSLSIDRLAPLVRGGDLHLTVSAGARARVNAGADRRALAPLRLVLDHRRAGRPRDIGRAVGGAVVHDVDGLHVTRAASDDGGDGGGAEEQQPQRFSADFWGTLREPLAFDVLCVIRWIGRTRNHHQKTRLEREKIGRAHV